MNDDDFHRFVYDEYASSSAKVESVYQRYPFVVTTIVVVTTATTIIGSNDYLGRFLERFDATIYYLALFGSFTASAIATLCLILSIRPRCYQELNDLDKLNRWRADYRAQLEALEKYTPEEIASAVAKESRSAVTGLLIEARDWNQHAGHKRMQYYNWSVYATSVAVVCLGIAALLYWAMGLKGVELDAAPAAAPPTSAAAPAKQASGTGP